MSSPVAAGAMLGYVTREAWDESGMMGECGMSALGQLPIGESRTGGIGQ